MLSELYAGMYKEASYSSQALLRIKLGVDNGGILLLGASGEGKSSAGQSLACQYVSKGVSVLGIDLNQTMSPSHICPQLRSNFEDVAIRHDLYQHPVPSGLIRPVMYGDYVEDPYNTAYGLSEIIGQNKRLHLGPAQIATLADAIQPLVECRNICPQIFPGILDELEKSSSVNARRLAKRLAPLLHHNVFECRQDGGTSLPLSPHIHIFDLSSFPSGIKKTLAELLLYDWFRAARMLHAPFCIMIDEVQNLSAGPNSVLGQIISEGRNLALARFCFPKHSRASARKRGFVSASLGISWFFGLRWQRFVLSLKCYLIRSIVLKPSNC